MSESFFSNCVYAGRFKHGGMKEAKTQTNKQPHIIVGYSRKPVTLATLMTLISCHFTLKSLHNYAGAL